MMNVVLGKIFTSFWRKNLTHEVTMAYRRLDPDKQTERAIALSQTFANRIIGQDDATQRLISLLEKFESGLYDKSKPIGSLLFLGPTGVGKTATVEAFVEGLYDDPKAMMKISCAEFQHSHEIAKLIGSPPGYLGHRETHPFFTNDSIKAARSNKDVTSDKYGKEVQPFTVILFDEIEKASDALWSLMLGILDKGELTTGTNEKVDMTKTFILMTSNVGAAELANDNPLGFSSGEAIIDDEKLKDIAVAAARRKFMPEFLNRLDAIVMFKTLTREALDKILSLELHKLQALIIGDSNRVFMLNLSETAYAQILKEGYDPKYNARYLKRAVDKHIAIPLSKMVATHQIENQDIVLVHYDKGWQYSATKLEK